jgi:hypothetical protein
LDYPPEFHRQELKTPQDVARRIYVPSHCGVSMSKRKQQKLPKKPSKVASRPSKVASKAHRASQAVVRSAKRKHSMPESSNGASAEAHVAASVISQEPTAASELAAIASEPSFPATSNLAVFETRLPDIAQVNMRLAFEFAQRLTQIRSPFEFPSVLSEFTLRQIAVFQEVVSSMVLKTPKPIEAN